MWAPSILALASAAGVLPQVHGGGGDDVVPFLTILAPPGQRAPPHTPHFTVESRNMSMLGSRGYYNLTVDMLLDTNPVGISFIVASYVHRDSFITQTNGSPMGELNLLCPVPELCPQSLPASSRRYGWAWLWGARVTTIPWLDCCSDTGDYVGYGWEVSSDATQATLSEWQTWLPNGTIPGRDARSRHNFTVEYSSVYGYVINAAMSLRINAAAITMRQVEFVNFLTPRLANPWSSDEGGGGGLPFPNTRSNITAWAGINDTTAWNGFAQNLLAGAMLRTFSMPGSDGAIAFISPAGWSAAIAYSGSVDDGVAGFAQSTCPTWLDQHNFVILPATPNDGDYFRIQPRYTIAWLPPNISHEVARQTVLIDHSHDGTRGGGAAVMLRVGELNTLEDQPTPLTRSVRALVREWSSPDYDLRRGPGIGVNGSDAALAVTPLPLNTTPNFYAFSNQQPLVPLAPSTHYAFSAWARLVASPGEHGSGGYSVAFLSCTLFEADDFNVKERLVNFTSAALNTTVLPTEWQRLDIAFLSPVWVSYADIRFEVYETPGLDSLALFDDVLFDQH